MLFVRLKYIDRQNCFVFFNVLCTACVVIFVAHQHVGSRDEYLKYPQHHIQFMFQALSSAILVVSKWSACLGKYLHLFSSIKVIVPLMCPPNHPTPTSETTTYILELHNKTPLE